MKKILSLIILVILITGCINTKEVKTNEYDKEDNVLKEESIIVNGNSINKEFNKTNIQEDMSNNFNEINKQKDEIVPKKDKILTKEEVRELVESIDPMNQKPVLSEDELKEIISSIKSGITDEEYIILKDTIRSCSNQISSIVYDNRYLELVDKNNTRWDAYENNNLYGVNVYLNSLLNFVKYEPLIADINSVIELNKYALKNRDVLAIIDSHRILRDLATFFEHGHFYVLDENVYDAEKGEYVVGVTSEGKKVISYMDKRYYGVTKTLKDNTNLLSDYWKLSN